MVLFKLISTNFTEEARKISEKIALLPKDQWKEVDFENNTPRPQIALSHIPGEVTIPFSNALNNSIVRDVQRLVADFAKAKIRKAKPEEYQLPPTVLRLHISSQQSPPWLETSKHDIVILQSFHAPHSNAKLKLRNKSTGEADEVTLQHNVVVVVFEGVMYQPVPLQTPILTQKLFIEPADDVN